MMRAFLVCLLTLLTGAAVAESCCVDEDFAAAFFTNITYSREPVTSFPAQLELEDLEYIGSARLAHSPLPYSLAWKTTLALEDAKSVVADALSSDGWEPLPDQAQLEARMQVGFVPHTRPWAGAHQQFCRGRDGLLTVMARDTNIGVVLTLSSQTDPRGQDCAELLAERSMIRRSLRGMRKHVPTLRLSEEVRALGFGGSGGGGRDGFDASISVETDLSPAGALGTFESQLTEQSWSLDTSFVGSSLTGEVWQRRADDRDLICIITATPVGDSQMKLRMHVSSADEAPGTGAVRALMAP